MDQNHDTGALEAPAHTRTSPLPRQAYPRPPVLRVAQGGEHATLTAGTHPAPRHGGGPRGPVRGKSRGSRRRLTRLLASLDKARHPASRTLFITVTYTGTWPPDPETWAANWKRFKRLLEERFGPLPGIWTKEFSWRGCPHWHLFLMLPDNVLRNALIRKAREIWHRISGAGDVDQRRYGIHAAPVRSWRQARGYVGKFEGHREPRGEDGQVLPTGKVWNTWRRELLTIAYRTVPVTGAAYLKLRRVFRRIARPVSGRSGVRAERFDTMHALVSETEMLRLLNLLGVSLP